MNCSKSLIFSAIHFSIFGECLIGWFFIFSPPLLFCVEDVPSSTRTNWINKNKVDCFHFMYQNATIYNVTDKMLKTL